MCVFYRLFYFVLAFSLFFHDRVESVICVLLIFPFISSWFKILTPLCCICVSISDVFPKYDLGVWLKNLSRLISSLIFPSLFFFLFSPPDLNKSNIFLLLPSFFFYILTKYTLPSNPPQLVAPITTNCLNSSYREATFYVYYLDCN